MPARESDQGNAFDFVARAPQPPLGRFVTSLWYARGEVSYAREKIAPTGSTVAVFVLGDPLVITPGNGNGRPFHAQRSFLLGPHDRPVVNQPEGETHAVGIVAKPIACQALYGLLPSTIAGRVVDLEGAWSPAVRVRQELLNAGQPMVMLDVVERRLTESLDDSIPGLDRCEKALAMIEDKPTRPVAEVASSLGISHGHLDREFARITGVSPLVLGRILRLQGMLIETDTYSEVDWLDLSMRWGWFDQAHLIRDFKRHTGVTPSQYVAAQRRHFTEEQAKDAAGFSPEL